MKQQKGALVLGAYLFLASLFSSPVAAESNFNFNDALNSVDVFQNEENKNTGCEIISQKDQEPLDKQYIKKAKELKKDGKCEEALTYYKKALNYNPKNFQAYFELGSLLYSLSKFDDAIKHFDKAISLHPNFAPLYFNVSLCHMQKKDIDKTIEYLKKSIEVDPSYKKAYNQLGAILHKHKKDEEAVVYLKKAHENNPEAFDMILLLGRALRNLDRLEEAVPYFRKALEKRPESTVTLLELANTLNMLGNNMESLDLYQKALEINPEMITVKYNVAYTMKKMGYVQESLKMYKEVLKEKPDYAQAHFSMALAYLLLGDWEKGWEEYEYRWESYNENKRTFDQPLWDGSNPCGKRVLLCAEQGLGDTFQFIRYGKILKNMGATVIAQTQRPLSTVLKLCPYIDEVYARGEELPDFDCYAHMLSMPLLCKTRVDTVPSAIPYLHADPTLVQYWKDQLPKDTFNIGICWQGNKKYRTQALRHAVAAKSMHAKLFKPIADIPGVKLYCLQKVNGEEQIGEIDFDIHTFGEDFDNSHGRFMDTAAIIKNLDLVITVDTSICHLSAALGTPVWTMLPNPADWRWMLKTDKTPWYPNMKLFRQKEFGSWEAIIDSIVQELYNILNEIQEESEINLTSVPSSSSGQAFSYAEDTEDRPSFDIPPATPQDKPTSDSNKNIDKVDNDTVIEFYDMRGMLFEEVLDEIIILKIRYEQTKDAQLEQELETLEKKLREISSIYNTDSEKLDELTEKMYEINAQLLCIDKELSQMKNKSVLNKSFLELTKKAHHILNLKRYIKNEINLTVAPQ